MNARPANPDPAYEERPELFYPVIPADEIGITEQRLSFLEKFANVPLLRKLIILFSLVALWEVYTIIFHVQPLLFPRFSQVFLALVDSLSNGELISRILASLRVLMIGYAIGLAAGMLLSTLAVTSRGGSDFLSTMTSLFNPLPAIALLPLALLWFGLGTGSLVFVLIHSVLWAVALNTHSGFLAVPTTLRMVGRNYGLSGLRYVRQILVPAAFPSILSGLKIGWAFAWRTLIAAELVFGATGSSGGLGWFIYQNRYEMNTDYVFAGLFTVILIGFAVENLVFRQVELRTVNKWGMQV